MEQNLSHAYIVAGAPEEAYAAALRLAQAMLCAAPENARPCGACPHCRKIAAGVHPDVVTVARQTDDKGKPKREIYVEQVRDIVADAYILPNEAERKVYIIRDAGTMNPAAQNALLKILEEPPPFVSLILAASSEALLLETVRSRCALRRAGAGEAEEAPPPEALERAEAYLAAAAGASRVALLRFAGENGELSGTEAREFILAARWAIADMLCGRKDARGLGRAELLRLAKLMEKADEYLRFNVGTKHILGMLSAETIQTNE